MNRKRYVKPAILKHEPIAFETGLSNCMKICDNICIKPDKTWDYIP